MHAQGYHGDTSRMFTVGRVSDKARQLCAVTLEALEAAVALCGPGVPVRKIGEVPPSSLLSLCAACHMHDRSAVQLTLLAYTAILALLMLSNSTVTAMRLAVAGSCCLKGSCCAAQVVERIAQRHKYGIVKDFVGHGVGKVFHASPLVHHTRNMERGTMQVGQTFTIEPILTTGGTAWKMWKDDWTVVTKDASLAAQYEHTVLITEGGHDILTTWPERR